MAQVKPANIFGNDMVLQRNKPIPVWGTASPGEKITVQLHGQQKKITAGEKGEWMIRLNPEKAGGPYILIISGKNKVELLNIYVGDVWICSGQSNMEWPLNEAQNAREEMASANYPQIRHIKILNETASSPKEDITKTNWKICSPQTAGNFTAVGYFFAREIFKNTHVPIGIINTSWGGTMVETWTSLDAFQQSIEYQYLFKDKETMNLAAHIEKRKQAMMKKIEALQGKFSETEKTENWKENSFDDSSWPGMQLPSGWESKGLAGLDGSVWFRKKITIPDSLAGRPAILLLSKIDDNDITWVNGVQVGATNKWDEDRKYKIEPGILKPGINVIAVRVEDTGGGGGLYGNKNDMKLVLGNETFSIDGNWNFKVESLLNAGSVSPNDFPSLLYNSMVHPMIPFAFTGVLWYQGETNAERAYQYRTAFPLLIQNWRKKWNAGDFPFYFVQLSSYDPSRSDGLKGSTWAELREAQSLTLKLPNTGMAVATDIGNADDIHPRNKLDVGKRLAAIALNKVYHKKNNYSGPVFSKMQQNGNKIILSFTSVSKGLQSKNGSLKGFTVAGNDGIFYPAEARIEGRNVIVWSAAVNKPAAARYGWKDDAGEANLYNTDGFPAPPFRTDTAECVTAKEKFAF